MKLGLYLLSCGVGVSLGCFVVAEWTGDAWNMTGMLASLGRASILAAAIGFATAIIGAIRVGLKS